MPTSPTSGAETCAPSRSPRGSLDAAACRQFGGARALPGFLSSLLNALPCPIFGKDATGRFLGGNAAFDRLARDLDPSVVSAAAPRWPKGLSHPPADAESSLLADGAPFRYEAVLPEDGGSGKEVSISCTPLRDHSGSTVGLAGIICDLSESKKRERSILEKNRELESRLAERAYFIADINNHLSSMNQELMNVLAEREQLEKELEASCRRLKNLVEEMNYTEEKERRRISTELHDNVVQNLALAQLKINMQDRSATAEELIASFDQILESAITEIRDICYDLSPPLLYEVGLAEALASLGGRLSSEHRFTFTINGTLPNDLPAETRILLYQSVRELLNNIVKHAQAKTVTVRMRKRGPFAHLLVTDDGVGFHPDAKKGFGLANIKQRISLAEGWFKITSRPGLTTAELSLPIPS
ncbi:sensor histidine kinase [Geomesophilobacter sediminis]|uniref:PAS domain-containing protein n=1 Tax=Geomesophilobacter sediminis TaxID=2798584 RepID=A0A8J7LYY5_9BACT|nr:histidine kinase [Geomesophilobacter sediminis]MBJ6725737.1 PAS domain-containing protein [Geomesophilobacter sediminis]